MARIRLALAATTVLLALPGAAHAACPAGTTCTDAYFPSGDGTQLHADVILPQGTESERHPVILSIGPYFGHGGQQGFLDYSPTNEGPNTRFADLYTEGKIFAKGYALVQVDLRGFGASQGCNDFGGPGEQMDAKAAVEWAAAQPWSNGKVGMWGKSYDGWTQVMALDEKPRGLAAAIIQSPIIDGYRTLYQEGVHYDVGWYNTPALYQQIDLGPPSLFDSPEYVAGFLLGTNPPCYAQNIALQNATIDHDTDFWRARDLPRARGSDVPILWSHGFIDANTKPDNFLPVWETLTGPKRAWFGQFAHTRPQDKRTDGRKGVKVGREGFIDEAMRWLDRYVAGRPARVEDDPAVEVEDGAAKRYRAEAAWPPADAAPHALTVNNATTTNQLGNNGEGPSAGTGTWSVSVPLPHDAHLAGVPVFTFTTNAPDTGRANVHAILYDIDADGRATLVSRGARSVTQAGRVRLELYPQDWTFKAGHRVGFLVAPSDDDWYLSLVQGGTYSLTEGSVALPFLRWRRDTTLPSVPSQDELERPAPFAAAALIEGATTALEIPAVLTTPPVTTLPGTPARGKKPRRLSVTLRRSGRTLVARGTAPAGLRLTVRLQRSGRTVATRRVTARGGRFTVRFRAPRRARYRALVTTRQAGATVRVRSRQVR